MQQRPCILVVDDEDAIKRLLSELLHDEGYAVCTAANGHAALAHATTTPLDLVITDVMMPGMNGVELMQRLRALPATATVPIIVMTAARHVPPIPGTTAVFAKPFDLDSLLTTVAQVIAPDAALS